MLKCRKLKCVSMKRVEVECWNVENVSRQHQVETRGNGIYRAPGSEASILEDEI